MCKRMTDNININAGRIADGQAAWESVGNEIFDLRSGLVPSGWGIEVCAVAHQAGNVIVG